MSDLYETVVAGITEIMDRDRKTYHVHIPRLWLMSAGQLNDYAAERDAIYEWIEENDAEAIVYARMCPTHRTPWWRIVFSEYRSAVHFFLSRC